MDGFSLSSWAGQVTGPVNEFLGRYAYLITYLVVGFIVIRFIQKLRNRHNAKAFKRYESGTTNKWFSWEKYNEWKREQNQENQQK